MPPPATKNADSGNYTASQKIGLGNPATTLVRS